jgi:hypothetical protein
MAKLTITDFLSSVETRKAASMREASEAQRIEALASDGNRRLLIAIEESRPRSISELARLVGR